MGKRENTFGHHLSIQRIPFWSSISYQRTHSKQHIQNFEKKFSVSSYYTRRNMVILKGGCIEMKVMSTSGRDCAVMRKRLQTTPGRRQCLRTCICTYDSMREAATDLHNWTVERRHLRDDGVRSLSLARSFIGIWSLVARKQRCAESSQHITNSRTTWGERRRVFYYITLSIKVLYRIWGRYSLFLFWSTS
jgi:hypothetical protein